MTDPNQALSELADRYGIAREFWDWKGRHRRISAETIIAVLAAMDIDATSDQACWDALAASDRKRWRQTLPPCTVAEEGQGIHVVVHVPAGTSVTVQVQLENGQFRPAWQSENWESDREVDGVWLGEATFWLGEDLPVGYHRLIATTERGTETASLIVTPTYVGLPPRLRGKRVWGYNTQLYSVTSKHSWGIGDLGDLGDLITWSGTKQFADYVLINPLHATGVEPPLVPSPYLPASRRFINPIYIRPESIDEYRDLGMSARRRVHELRKQARKIGRADAIDRDAVWPLKLEALRIIFDQGLRPARLLAFSDFQRREGDGLRNFAIWSVLSLHFGPNWKEWPEEYRQPGGPEVDVFAQEHTEDVAFYCWLQWIAQLQVSSAQKISADVGMDIGIITDLAVGVSEVSAETWMMSDVYAKGINVGAPPDAYNQHGQDWGQPPWRPDRLEALAYAPFRAMVSAALRRSGGVRIDHVIGLFRLWWVPQGLGPTQGTYVRYNHEALVGILALEASRAQALVIGEDLGTVEPWVRTYLARRGLLGTSVLWFESGMQDEPLDARWWRELCMASVTTHDLPPTLGYLAGEHVYLRERLGLLTEPLEEELTAARAEQQAWIDQLISYGVLKPERADDHIEVMLALHRYLLATPSRILLASLADAVGEKATQNMPGTDQEYPNWRIPLHDASGRKISLEEVFSADLPRRLAAVMNGMPQQPESRWD
ncbi:4-alpha-glucanotransferase [Tessaracoccus caeni]|uniref:4-alpha-glucanotransferase n=1 Tax=Tessaracoccus caeni TaxID=3031239 RepID=UPI0023DA14AC|nr:4-alpha-glucanotransferase [Tessaracoccus caeni]MDF1488941.1 4-alpha-glucanotransferase [Tessaracoccus caeni]